MSSGSQVIEEVIASHGSCITHTHGVSMRPLFATKRDAVVLCRPEREIGKYDVVLYKHRDRYVLHRVIRVKGDTLVIRGDNTFVKEYVSRDNIIAYMTAFNRKGKHRSVTDTSYVIYSRLWNFIYPVRFVLHKIRRLLGKIKRKIFK